MIWKVEIPQNSGLWLVSQSLPPNERWIVVTYSNLNGHHLLAYLHFGAFTLKNAIQSPIVILCKLLVHTFFGDKVCKGLQLLGEFPKFWYESLAMGWLLFKLERSVLFGDALYALVRSGCGFLVLCCLIRGPPLFWLA